MKRIIIIILGALCYGVVIAGEGLTINSEAGQAAEIEIPNFQLSGLTNFSLSIKKFNGGSDWAPYIYYSLNENEVKNSFRLSLIRDTSKGPVTAFVEYYKDGNNIVRESLVYKIPLGAVIKFTLAWNKNGSVEYTVLGGKLQKMNTSLKFNGASVHISNSEATFYP